MAGKKKPTQLSPEQRNVESFINNTADIIELHNSWGWAVGADFLGWGMERSKGF